MNTSQTSGPQKKPDSPVKIYDRPERKSLSPALWLGIVIVLLIVLFGLYKAFIQ